MNNKAGEANLGDALVLIVGGGIGGLALALALSRKNIRSRVFEQASEFGEIGAGIQLGPNAHRAIQRLGIGERIRDAEVAVGSLRMMDSLSGKCVFEMPLAERIAQRFDETYAVIHRADMHRALLDACRESPLIRLDTSRHIMAFDDDGKKVVVRNDTGETFEGSALVGADGIWSRVRSQLLADGKPTFAGHTAYRALLDPDEMPEAARWHAATLWAGPNTHLVHYPISGGAKYNIVATFAGDWSQEGWNEPGDRDELLHHFRKVKGLPLDILRIPTQWRKWALCDREPVDTWSRGRVTLLGDAAHPMLQYFAQGSAMAMEDAICLADEVVSNDGDFAVAFKAYEHDRAPRTGKVQREARRLGRIYHARGVKRLLRNHFLKRMTPDRFYDSVDWLYSGP